MFLLVSLQVVIEDVASLEKLLVVFFNDKRRNLYCRSQACAHLLRVS